MKICILGTRGIPNNYGGFEQLAEYLSIALVERGHEVYVYTSSLHNYQKKKYKGVTIIHCFDAENKIGTAGQFIYDLNCILDSRKRNFDVILQLGYTSSSVWSFLFPKQSKIITNMDGLEWKRGKYSSLVKLFLKKAEGWAVNVSDGLISDSIGIQQYIQKKYQKNSTFIAYGATIFNHADIGILKKYNLEKEHYLLSIARFEPENNIEMIIKGFLKSNTNEILVLIGSTQNKFGKYIRSTYENHQIRFLESIYDINELNNLRFFSKLYFHGHSVGGTNPSLLEAMASQTLICAHRNEFNESVLKSNALYFLNDIDIADILKNRLPNIDRNKMIEENVIRIHTSYTWESIIDAYEKLMIDVK